MADRKTTYKEYFVLALNKYSICQDVDEDRNVSYPPPLPQIPPCELP